MYVLAEIGCPEPGRGGHFVTPQIGYLLLRDGNVLRTTTRGETFSRRPRSPATQGEHRRRQRRPDRRGVRLAGRGRRVPRDGNAAFRTTDGGDSWTPEGDVETGSVRRVRARSRDDRLRRRPRHAAALDRRGPDLAAPRRGQRAPTSPASAARPPDLCLLTTARGAACCGPRTAACTAETIAASTSRSSPPASRPPPAAWRSAPAVRPSVSDDGGRTYAPVGGDIARLVPVRPASRAGPEIAIALGARGQLARTIDGGATWRAINVATSADMQRRVVLDPRRGLRARPARQPVPHRERRAELAADRPGHDLAAARGDHLRRRVLLAGPRGVRRATVGGAFDLVDAVMCAGRRSTAFDRPAARSSPSGGRRSSARRTAARRGPRPRARDGGRAAVASLPARRPRDDVGDERLRARERRPRLADDHRRAHVAQLPGVGTDTGRGAGVRLGDRRLPDARQLPRRPAAPRTCCARATAAGRGARSGSRPAVPGHRGRHQPERRRSPTR